MWYLKKTWLDEAPGINEDILHNVERLLPIANHAIHKAKERALQMAQMVRKGLGLWRLMGGGVRHDNSRIGMHRGCAAPGSR